MRIFSRTESENDRWLWIADLFTAPRINRATKKTRFPDRIARTGLKTSPPAALSRGEQPSYVRV